MLYPTTLLDELAFHFRVTLCWAGAVPAPLKDSATEPLTALLANVSVAEVLPEACGANVTPNETLCPEAIVSGKEIPLNENSVPVMPAEDTVTEPLLELKVAVCFRLEPTVTFPKLMLAGFTANRPGATVLPESGIETDGFAALELIESAPLIVPVDDDKGANVTLKVKL